MRPLGWSSSSISFLSLLLNPCGVHPTLQRAAKKKNQRVARILLVRYMPIHPHWARWLQPCLFVCLFIVKVSYTVKIELKDSHSTWNLANDSISPIMWFNYFHYCRQRRRGWVKYINCWASGHRKYLQLVLAPQCAFAVVATIKRLGRKANVSVLWKICFVYGSFKLLVFKISTFLMETTWPKICHRILGPIKTKFKKEKNKQTTKLPNM